MDLVGFFNFHYAYCIFRSTGTKKSKSAQFVGSLLSLAIVSPGQYILKNKQTPSYTRTTIYLYS
jgi:hypothetical protein